MPTYEYRCRGCKAIIDATRTIDDRRTPADCPICGDFADLVISQVSFPHSQKAWAGRTAVNFQADDRRDIAKKQVALMVNNDRISGYFDKTKMPGQARKAHMDAIGSMLKKAPPIKVDL